MNAKAQMNVKAQMNAKAQSLSCATAVCGGKPLRQLRLLLRMAPLSAIGFAYAAVESRRMIHLQRGTCEMRHGRSKAHAQTITCDRALVVHGVEVVDDVLRHSSHITHMRTQVQGELSPPLSAAFSGPATSNERNVQCARHDASGSTWCQHAHMMSINRGSKPKGSDLIGGR